MVGGKAIVAGLLADDVRFVLEEAAMRSKSVAAPARTLVHLYSRQQTTTFSSCWRTAAPTLLQASLHKNETLEVLHQGLLWKWKGFSSGYFIAVVVCG